MRRDRFAGDCVVSHAFSKVETGRELWEKGREFGAFARGAAAQRLSGVGNPGLNGVIPATVSVGDFSMSGFFDRRGPRLVRFARRLVRFDAVRSSNPDVYSLRHRSRIETQRRHETVRAGRNRTRS